MVSHTSSWISVLVCMKTIKPRLTLTGIVMRVIMLFRAVIEIDNATLPFKMYVMRFDVAPPGHAAIMIRPTFNIGSMLVRKAMENAINGNNRIWQQIPMVMAFGFTKTRLKSFWVMERPIPSVIIAS